MFFYIFFAVFIFLLFPINADINIFCDILKRKLYYGVYIFKFIKIYGGFLFVNAKGFKISITDKKNITAPFSDIFKQGIDLKLYKGFLLRRINYVLENGSVENPAGPVMLMTLTEALLSSLFNVLKTDNKRLNLKQNIILVENKDALKLSMNIVYLFNMLSVVMSLATIALNAGINAIVTGER